MSTVVSCPGIVVGVDGSPSSKAAVWWAARDAAMRDVSLTVVHILTPSAVVWPGTSTPVRFGQWQAAQAMAVIADASAIAEESTGGSGERLVSSEVMVSSGVPTPGRRPRFPWQGAFRKRCRPGGGNAPPRPCSSS